MDWSELRGLIDAGLISRAIAAPITPHQALGPLPTICPLARLEDWLGALCRRRLPLRRFQPRRCGRGSRGRLRSRLRVRPWPARRSAHDGMAGRRQRPADPARTDRRTPKLAALPAPTPSAPPEPQPQLSDGPGACWPR
jgi:hypothetical protein